MCEKQSCGLLQLRANKLHTKSTLAYSAIHMVCRIVAASKLFAAWQQQGSSQCPSAAGAGMGPSKSGNISYTFCGYVQHGQHCMRNKRTLASQRA